MIVLTLLTPPVLLGAVLFLGRFEERLVERISARPQALPEPADHGQCDT
ncbi:hypothetical protein ACIQWA_07175 [Kitasatospora sp. NPDC098652]